MTVSNQLLNPADRHAKPVSSFRDRQCFHIVRQHRGRDASLTHPAHHAIAHRICGRFPRVSKLPADTRRADFRTIADMAAAEPDLTGVLLEGRYRVDELLAVGGMSRVYRGTDTRLDRAVAIKVMDSRLAADPAFRGRFEREARAIARIDHPGV